MRYKDGNWNPRYLELCEQYSEIARKQKWKFVCYKNPDDDWYIGDIWPEKEVKFFWYSIECEVSIMHIEGRKKDIDHIIELHNKSIENE